MWRYRLFRPLRICAPELVGVSFRNQWVVIEGGAMEIAAGYAWDGCSPAVPLFGVLWLGPWDGPLRYDGRPVAWRATLAHDVLCQFRHEIRGLRKEQTVKLFRRLLATAGAPRWMVWIYTKAVDVFGPQHWIGDYL